MEFRFTNHVQREIQRRAIPQALLDRVLAHPQQIVPEREGRKAYQSLVDFGGGRVYLLRVIVQDSTNPALVVTAYRTTKVAKYWRDRESDL